MPSTQCLQKQNPQMTWPSQSPSSRARTNTCGFLSYELTCVAMATGNTRSSLQGDEGREGLNEKHYRLWTGWNSNIWLKDWILTNCFRLCDGIENRLNIFYIVILAFQWIQKCSTASRGYIRGDSSPIWFLQHIWFHSDTHSDAYNSALQWWGDTLVVPQIS